MDTRYAGRSQVLFEVSFTPSWLALNASQTVTFYKGITSPPRDMGAWGALVQRMGAHLRARYPEHAFMFEIWNEPNGGFWTPPSGNGSAPATDAQKRDAYFELYKSTADALKNASGGAYLVGGPATAGCPGWAAELVAFGEARDGSAVTQQAGAGDFLGFVGSPTRTGTHPPWAGVPRTCRQADEIKLAATYFG